MRGFSHGSISSLLLVLFILWGIAILTEERDKDSYEPR